MSNEKINVQLPEGSERLTVLHGEAPQPKRTIEEADFSISGEIDAPKIFYQQLAGKAEVLRNKDSGPYENIELLQNPMVQIDRAALSVRLVCKPYLNLIQEIVGRLEFNKDLQVLGINDSKTYTLEQLANTLKRNRLFFTDPEKAMELTSLLKNFKGKVQREIESLNDDKGNKKQMVAQRFSSNLDLKFSLNMPVFKGEKPSTFEVEILLDVRDAGVTCWLESAELQDIAYKTRDEKLDALKAYFKDKMAVIEV